MPPKVRWYPLPHTLDVQPGGTVRLIPVLRLSPGYSLCPTLTPDLDLLEGQKDSEVCTFASLLGFAKVTSTLPRYLQVRHREEIAFRD